MFCSKCGSDVSDELNSCPICGASLSGAEENGAEESARMGTASSEAEDGKRAFSDGGYMGASDAFSAHEGRADACSIVRRVLMKNNERKIIRICGRAILWALAVAVFITAFIGANKLDDVQKLISTMSVYGYAADGNQLWLYICSGFAYLMRTIGIFFAAVLAWMGIKL